MSGGEIAVNGLRRRGAARRGGSAAQRLIAPLTTNGLGEPVSCFYTEARMPSLRRIAALTTIAALLCAQTLPAQGNSWNRLRYTGGTVPAKVDPYDWNSAITISADAIELSLGRRHRVKIAPSDVTALSYGQEAHRRIAEIVAISVVIPFALFGLLHKSKQHFIGIEYKTPDGKTGAVLLEADKGVYRPLIHTLKAVTGKPVKDEPK
jgi:hypothetical protein